MKVYIVVSTDAGGIFYGVYASRSQAEDDLAKVGFEAGLFEILEEEI